MTDFLQKKLKSKHLRLLNIDEQLKKLKQRSDQIVSKLIFYLKSLEDQLSERSSKMQKHNNLLHFLHDYLQKVIIRVNFQNKNRVKLIEAARVIERVKSKLDFLRISFIRTQSRSEKKENFSRSSYARRSFIYTRTIISFKSNEPKNADITQALVTSSNFKRSRNENFDISKFTC